MKKNSNQIKEKFNTFPFILLIALIFYSLFLLMPLIYGFITSFKSYEDYIVNPISFPSPITIENYEKAIAGFFVRVDLGTSLKKIYFEKMLVYTLLYAFGCAFTSVAIPTCAAYVVANYDFKICKIVYAFVVISMVLPIVGSLPSEIQLAQKLGLYDKIIGMWIMSGHIRSMYFLILVATFKNVPKGFQEAAEIDGAGQFTIFFKIMLPLISGALLTIFIIKFIDFWNDYQTALVMIPTKPTVSYGLYMFRYNGNTDYATTPMVLTGCMMIFIPIFTLFMIFKNRIVGNLTFGGLKY